MTETSASLKSEKLAVISFGFGILCGWLLRGPNSVSKLLPKAKVFENAFSWFQNPDYKLTLVVRNDLRMGKGKICAQCSHASVVAYKNILKLDPTTAELWERCGQGKVVVQTDSEESLLKLAEQATNSGLPANIVCDAGKTQVLMGTRTVLAVGPDDI